jgi:hypothetical protein
MAHGSQIMLSEDLPHTLQQCLERRERVISKSAEFMCFTVLATRGRLFGYFLAMQDVQNPSRCLYRITIRSRCAAQLYRGHPPPRIVEECSFKLRRAPRRAILQRLIS